MRVALDTNILAYAEGVGEAARHASAVSLIALGSDEHNFAGPDTRRVIPGFDREGQATAARRPRCHSRLVRQFSRRGLELEQFPDGIRDQRHAQAADLGRAVPGRRFRRPLQGPAVGGFARRVLLEWYHCREPVFTEPLPSSGKINFVND